MNPLEAADLLAYAAGFDNRQPSIAASQAWSNALQDIPLDQDAFDAVAAYYSADGAPGERRWLMPFHVRHYRGAARAERIRAANVIYDGNPLESGPESVRSLQNLLRAAGDGQFGERTTRQAIPDRRPLELEAGPSSRLKAAITAIGAKPPRQVPGVTNPLSVGCPKCAAKPGKSCASGLRKRRVHADPHPSRVEFAKRLAAGLTEDGAA